MVWLFARGVPHNIAALISGLIGFLLLWSEHDKARSRQRTIVGFMAGVAFSSLIGCSVYVAMIFAIFLGLWTIWLVYKSGVVANFSYLIAAAVTCLLVAPHLSNIAGNSSGTHFLAFSVRHFNPVEDFAISHSLTNFSLIALRLLTLPIQYFLELGTFFLGSVLYLARLRKKQPLTDSDRALLLLTGVSLLIVTFIKSRVVGTNDLGWRGFLPLQFVLLLWTSEMLTTLLKEKPSSYGSPNRRLLLSIMFTALTVGITGTTYDFFILRFQGALSDIGVGSPLFVQSTHLGQLTSGVRDGYEKASVVLPAAALIQANPNWEQYDFFFGLYAHHPTAAFDRSCGTEYGGDPSICKALFPVWPTSR